MISFLFLDNTGKQSYVLKIIWKMEHLLQKSKCSIFYNIFKYIIFQSRQRVLIWSKELEEVLIMIITKILSIWLDYKFPASVTVKCNYSMNL